MRLLAAMWFVGAVMLAVGLIRNGNPVLSKNDEGVYLFLPTVGRISIRALLCILWPVAIIAVPLTLWLYWGGEDAQKIRKDV